MAKPPAAAGKSDAPSAAQHGSGHGDGDRAGAGKGDAGGHDGKALRHGTHRGEGDHSGAGTGDGAGSEEKQARHGSGRGKADRSGVGTGDAGGHSSKALRHGTHRGEGDHSGAGTGDGAGSEEKQARHGSGRGPGDHGGAGAGDRSGEDGGAATPIGFTPHLQYRGRYEHRSTSNGASSQGALLQRARFGLTGRWRDWLDVRVELQDVRNWGDEVVTTSLSSFGFDAHQAYATLTATAGLELRVGRQAIRYGNGRLVGDYDFLQQGRSFDALRVRHRISDFSMDAFFAVLDAGDYGATATTYGSEADHHLAGAELRYAMMPAFRAHLLGLFERRGVDGYRHGTAGAMIRGDVKKMLHYSAEGYYQFGESYGDNSFSAFLAAADLKARFGVKTRPFLGVGVTAASGDETPSDKLHQSFRTNFGSPHLFHGEMDAFVDLPNGAGDRGLLDTHATLGIEPLADLSMHVKFHIFRAMLDRDGEYFGQEIDLKASYSFWNHVEATAFYGMFLPGDIARTATATDDVSHFAYLMLDVHL